MPSFHWIELLGWAGAAASLYTCLAKTMIPLRAAAIIGNAFGLSFALATGNSSGMVLNGLFVAVNALRLVQMIRLVSRVKAASSGATFDASWLTPFMKPVRFAQGETLFEKGHEAREAFVVLAGTVRLPDLDVTVPHGTMLGEMGLFTSDQKRTATAVCETDALVLRISYEQFEQLYFQNPRFGFYLMRMVVQRYEASLNTGGPAASSRPVAPERRRIDLGLRRGASAAGRRSL